MQRFNFKTFTSFLLVLTSLSLVVSGIILFLAPRGRVANWTDWALMGLGKEEWGAVHILMAIVFLTGSLFHLLKFNWKVFAHYLKTKRKGFRYTRELLSSIVIFSVVLAGTLVGVPPFISVINFQEDIKDYWEDYTSSPPVPHMELMSLTEVASKLQMSEEQLASRLQENGLSVGAEDRTLQELAQSNGTSPRKIFRILNLSQTPSGAEGTSEPGMIRQGLGRQTLKEIALGFKIPVSEAVRRLRDRAVEAEAEERLKDIAERAQMSPHDLLAILEGVTVPEGAQGKH
ncbi:MAG: DUF4405 domain-containing protein [bacterium]